MLSEEKIKALMDYFDVKSVKQLEIRLGLSNGYISNLQRKGTENPGRMLVALNENGISADWFFSASETMVLDGLKKQPNDIKLFTNRLKNQPIPPLPGTPAGGTIEASGRRPPGVPLVYEGDRELGDGIVIPLLENAASAGYGAELGEDDVPARYVRVPRYLARYPHLASLPVKGDSMEPTLHDGDLVVCDGGGWDGDGIYVLKTHDTTYLKRVQLSSGGYKVISDNRMYESFTESAENLSIVGRVRAILVIVPGRRGGV